MSAPEMSSFGMPQRMTEISGIPWEATLNRQVSQGSSVGHPHSMNEFYPQLFVTEPIGGSGGKLPKEVVKAQIAAPAPQSRPAANFQRPSFGFGAGPKACTQCGTTRTPQWREGPLGPKTLCNACGVKRVRQMRLHTEGNKRRPSQSKPAAPAASVQSLKATSSGALSSDSLDDMPLTMDASDAEANIVKRPVRKAAARAASRTAEFAASGDWPEDDETSPVHRGARLPYLNCDESDDESGEENSDSAEEVAWAPVQRHPAPPSPMVTIGVECAAAVNLLTMSAKDKDAEHRIGSSQAGASSSAPAQQSGGDSQAQQQMTVEQAQMNSANYVAMANAMKYNYELPIYEKALSGLQETLRTLPPAKHMEYMMLKEEVDTSTRESAAADAAVAAVAKILAIKQAAAIRARTANARAVKKMHQYLSTLDDENNAWLRAAAPAQKKRRST
ncbi:hypothetical protein WJX72_002048 [[Myrmecia] bisecta]|uniref:GATA-type domain-containing protein n=1 Tax=[Myrmecia] bisecta TaxID=41462 RepID=A0AAW1Q786_9CHLO